MALNPKIQIGPWHIYHGEPEGDQNLLQILRLKGQIVQDRLNVIIPKEVPTIAGDEQFTSSLDFRLASLPFEPLRRNVRDALRVIVGYIFNKFSLPSSNILDVGSGSTGCMVEELFPDHVDKSSCVQLEICKGAVDENRRRHPSSTIVTGSYLDLGIDEQVDMVTGLSSLDSTTFVDKAIEQIRNALKSGGYLLHVQDVGPGSSCGVQEILRQGEVPPLMVELPVAVNSTNARSKTEQILSYYSTREGKFLSIVELFRRRIAAAVLRTPGMELVFDDWVTACNPNSPERCGILYSGIGLPPTDFHKPVQMASAAVTIARKKAS